MTDAPSKANRLSKSNFRDVNKERPKGRWSERVKRVGRGSRGVRGVSAEVVLVIPSHPFNTLILFGESRRVSINWWIVGN